MDIRVLRVCVPQRGFRTRVVLVATTLLEAQVYSKEDLAGLHRARWHAELDLRSIKQTMQMDVLRCKTPAMVRKEIWGHLLVSHLLRAATPQAVSAPEGPAAASPRPRGNSRLRRRKRHSSPIPNFPPIFHLRS